VSITIFHAGIAGDTLLRPYFLAPHLTGAVYHIFPQNFIPELLQGVDLHTTMSYLWFMHNGAPAHFSLAVREFLNKVFPGQWIRTRETNSMASTF
jgi:hypothetical protein